MYGLMIISQGLCNGLRFNLVTDSFHCFKQLTIICLSMYSCCTLAVSLSVCIIITMLGMMMMMPLLLLLLVIELERAVNGLSTLQYPH